MQQVHPTPGTLQSRAALLVGALGGALLAPASHALLSERGNVATSPTGIVQIGNTSDGTIDVFGNDRSVAINPAEIARLPGVNGLLSVRDGSTLRIKPFTLPGAFGGAETDDSWLVVGLEGDGALAITEGSVLESPRWVPVGALPGSAGSIVVDGAGSRLAISGHLDSDVYGLLGGVIPQHGQGFLSIGPRGTGTVTVSNGGRIEVTQAGNEPTLVMGFGVFLGGEIGGNEGGGNGHLSVVGQGSAVAISGDNATLAVGTLGGDGFDIPGNGTLEIRDGAHVVVGGGGFATVEAAAIGAFAGTRGEAFVSGAGSLLDGGDNVSIGLNGTQFDTDPRNDIAGGTGVLTVSDGARVESDFGTFIGADGTLRGDGTVVGDVTAFGGTLEPGNSPGDLTVLGNVTLLDGATVEIEIDSATHFDRIVSTGVFRLGGGTVRFLFASGIDPSLIETFDVGDFFARQTATEEIVSGVAGRDLLGLSSLVLEGFAPGYRIDAITLDGTGFKLDAAPVPLPGTAALLMPALAWVVQRRRTARPLSGCASRQAVSAQGSEVPQANVPLGVTL